MLKAWSSSQRGVSHEVERFVHSMQKIKRYGETCNVIEDMMNTQMARAHE